MMSESFPQEWPVVTASPLKEVSATKPLQEFNGCVVCYEDYSTYADVPCGHKCCFTCLREWFKKSRTCPICRKKLLRSCVTEPLPSGSRKRVRDENVIELLSSSSSSSDSEEEYDYDDDSSDGDFEDIADFARLGTNYRMGRPRVVRQRRTAHAGTKSAVLCEMTLNHMLEGGRAEYLRGDINRALQEKPEIIALYPEGCRDRKKYLDGSFQTIELSGALEYAGIRFVKRSGRMYYSFL